METLTTKVDESGGSIIFHHYKVKALTSPKKHKTLWDASIVTLFSEGPRKIDIRIYEHFKSLYHIHYRPGTPVRILNEAAESDAGLTD